MQTTNKEGNDQIKNLFTPLIKNLLPRSNTTFGKRWKNFNFKSKNYIQQLIIDVEANI